jgi:urease accessory protein UreE
MPEPQKFDKGLVFVKDADILLSGDKWTIVVNIALDDYAILTDLMQYMLNYICQEIQVRKNPKLYSFDIL